MGIEQSFINLKSNTNGRHKSFFIPWQWEQQRHHIVNTIINYYDVDYESEEAAYLQGYVMRKIIEVL